MPEPSIPARPLALLGSAGAVLLLSASNLLGADLFVKGLSWQGTGSSVSAAVDVQNNSPRGSKSGSIRVELRLSTTPHNVTGRFYTLLRPAGQDGLSGGYMRRYTASGNYTASSFEPGSYYLVASIQEYTGTGWVIRTAITSDSKFTVAKAGNILGLGEWSWSISKGVASGEVKVSNTGSGGTSGSLKLELRLSTAPYGKGGKYWVSAASEWLPQVKAGYWQVFKFSSPFDSAAYPPGQYYVTVVLKEKTTEGLVEREGATSRTPMTINER